MTSLSQLDCSLIWVFALVHFVRLHPVSCVDLAARWKRSTTIYGCCFFFDLYLNFFVPAFRSRVYFGYGQDMWWQHPNAQLRPLLYLYSDVLLIGSALSTSLSYWGRRPTHLSDNALLCIVNSRLDFYVNRVHSALEVSLATVKCIPRPLSVQLVVVVRQRSLWYHLFSPCSAS